MAPTSVIPPWRKRARLEAPEDLTLPVLTDRWLEQYKSPQTVRKYRQYAELYAEWATRYNGLHGLDVITKCTLDDLQDYFYLYLQSGHWDEHGGDCTSECASLPYKPPSLHAKKTALSSLFTYSVMRGLREHNIVTGIKLDPASSKTGTILLPDEIREVVARDLQAAANAVLKSESRIHLRSALVTALFFGAGIRCEEASNIDAHNITDTEDGGMSLYFRRKGANRWHTIDIPTPIVPLAVKYLGDRREGPLLLADGQRHRNKETGELEYTRVVPSTLYRGVRASTEMLGYRIAPHDGRRTSVSLATVHPEQPSLARIMVFHDHRGIVTTLGYRNADRLTSGFHTNPYGPDWANQAR